MTKAVPGATRGDHEELIEPFWGLEALEQRVLLSSSTLEFVGPLPASSAASIGAPVGQQPTGALTGKIIYTHPGHGWVDNNGWRTQRPLTHGMVEDFGNHDQMTMYVDYLFNAGATVVPLRPVGHQINEVIVDNMSPSVTWIGTWSNSSSSIYYGSPGDAVPYRFATGAATETAVAQYRPNIPEVGFYPVYAWAQFGSNRVPDQLYRVHHSGGATEVKVNHRMVGNGWVYLGTYHFDEGTGGYVEISNRTGGSGVVIADAIRFGNGIGPSGKPREDEAGLYWIQAMRGQGVPSSVHGTSTVSSPPRFAAHMNNQNVGSMTDRLFLSFHSNASGGRGTLGLYNDPHAATPNQRRWAELVGREVNDDLVAIGSPPLEHAWFNRSNVILNRSDINFGEINNTWINNEFDATILEVAFHDNQLDAELMRDPKARDWVARASYHATVKYFNEFSGTPVNLLPEKPTNLQAISNTNGDVTISWEKPIVDGVGGQAATGYRLYTSLNGYGFDGGIFIPGGNTTSYTIPAGMLDSGAYYFRVAAVNAGGESLPGEVVTARKHPEGRAPILIVNAFNRLERQQNPIQRERLSPGGALVSFDRVRPRFSNSFDYVIQAGNAITAYDYPLGFDSVSNIAIRNGEVNLNDYHTIIWMNGEQSSRDRTFTSAEQTMVSSFLSNGGKFFVSGSEIGWDLVARNNGPSFFSNTLRANFPPDPNGTTYNNSDNAGTYTASGVAGSIFAGISLRFDDGTLFYDVDFPDKIFPANGSSSAMQYTGSGSGSAGIQYADPSTGQRLVFLGFPFETVTTAANRNLVMSRVLDFFGTADIAPPEAEMLPVSQPESNDQYLWIVVRYSAAQAINVSTLSSSNLRVLGPDGFDRQAEFMFVDSQTNGSPRMAIYRLDNADGRWHYSFNGPYSVMLQANQVADTQGRFIPEGELGIFVIDLPLPGDANRDGRVDGEDFLVWQANFGREDSTWGMGDFNGDGRVDGEDFLIWQANFGRVAEAPTATFTMPQQESEPPSMAAASAGLLEDDADPLTGQSGGDLAVAGGSTAVVPLGSDPDDAAVTPPAPAAESRQQSLPRWPFSDVPVAAPGIGLARASFVGGNTRIDKLLADDDSDANGDPEMVAQALSTR